MINQEYLKFPMMQPIVCMWTGYQLTQRSERWPVIFFFEMKDVFRPYPGYQTARLITKEAKNGRKFYYCFVDFDSNSNASICKDSIQVRIIF
jgi:antibiotic biosynthesis monooxygenase (ABM) superfamily enzyme